MEFSFECQPDKLDAASARAIAATSLCRLTQVFGIPTQQAMARPLELVVGVGGSQVLGDRMHVDPSAHGRRPVAQYFEQLCAHELTHWLLPPSPALLWEGLPVWLGDNYVRSRNGSSYHDWSRALVELGQAPHLHELLRGRTYYLERPSGYVDIVAGSFCGFLLERYGGARVRESLQAFEPPSQMRPIVDVGPIVRGLGVARFSALVDGWHDMLAQRVLDPALVTTIQTRSERSRSPGRLRCDLCFGPVSDERCADCGAGADLRTVVVTEDARARSNCRHQ